MSSAPLDAAPVGPSSPPSRRIASLDGLRGLAALVVVVHHCVLVNPLFYTSVALPTRAFASGTWGFAFTYTPLHLLWAGTEAVYVFFVLSGVVLAFTTERANFRWLSYFPQRLLRLYLPVWAAIVFAALTMLLVPRAGDLALGPWIDGRDHGYGRHALLMDAVLLLGHSGIVSPLWSLRWEVWFSLLLPLYVLLLRLRGAWWWAAMASMGLVSSLGAVAGSEVLTYMPMFAVGVLAAARWDWLVARCRALSTASFSLLFLLSLVLLLSEWLMGGLFSARPLWAVGLAVVGAVVLVVGFAARDGLRRFGTSVLIAWLGRISFSLYLVHDPVILAVRYLFPGASPWMLLIPTVAVSLVVGWLFYRFVERPLHLVSRTVGAYVSRGLRRRPTAP